MIDFPQFSTFERIRDIEYLLIFQSNYLKTMKNSMLMIFKQISKITTYYKGETEENSYEWMFAVTPKGNTKKKSIAYDKNLKIYFENPSEAIYNYEVEFTNIRLNLCDRLEKSENFNRKLFYRYDFIEPQINSKGQVISILNKDQLKEKWQRLKASINRDHKGDYVQKYLDKIDSEFTTDTSIYPAMNQYLYFGLLFFNLPKVRSRRLIEFSPYEKEKFIENITTLSSNEKEVTYQINGESREGSSTKILKYEGIAIKGINDNFVRMIKLNTSIIKDDIISDWDFTFYKV